MLEKIEGRRRRGRLRMRWLDSITESINMRLSKLWEIMGGRRVWCAPVNGVTKSQTQSDWTTFTTSVITAATTTAASVTIAAAAAAAAKSLQSCPTLCDPIDGSPPGSPVPGILQARVLEWGAIPFSNAWKWKVKVKSLSRVWLLVTPWTAAHQAPPPMGLSRQECWSGCHRFSSTITATIATFCDHYHRCCYCY